MKIRKRRIAISVMAVAALLTAKAVHDTLADPVVRQAAIDVPELPPGTAPIRIVVLSDLHVSGPDMPPSRLAGIVAQVNALRPDLVLIAGDLVSDKTLATRHYPFAEALAPLAGLRPSLGTVAVLGNHDHWRDATAARAELAKVGAVVLNNSAVRLGGLTIGGLDDDFTGHANVAATFAAMDRLGPPFVVLGHSPDSFPALPPAIRLMVAGHTHCGQIRIPIVGAPATMSRFGERYACGRIDEAGRTLLVSAGLGTSVLPFRFGTRPDLWLVTLRPAHR